MNVLRLLLCLTVLAPLAANAAECVDDYTECKDDCLIEFGGSIQVAMKKKFEKCTNKCNKLARRCNERVMTVKESGLDEGSLDNTPASDEVDSRGMPNSKKKKRAAEPSRDEEPAQDEPVKKKEALRSDETPKSNRTELKSDEPPPAAKKEEPKQEVIEMKLTKQKEDDDIRDDKPRASSKSEVREEEPAPPPKKEKKKEEPKKKEEDHDDLRYY